MGLSEVRVSSFLGLAYTVGEEGRDLNAPRRSCSRQGARCTLLPTRSETRASGPRPRGMRLTSGPSSFFAARSLVLEPLQVQIVDPLPPLPPISLYVHRSRPTSPLERFSCAFAETRTWINVPQTDRIRRKRISTLDAEVHQWRRPLGQSRIVERAQDRCSERIVFDHASIRMVSNPYTL